MEPLGRALNLEPWNRKFESIHQVSFARLHAGLVAGWVLITRFGIILPFVKLSVYKFFWPMN